MHEQFFFLLLCFNNQLIFDTSSVLIEPRLTDFLFRQKMSSSSSSPSFCFMEEYRRKKWWRRDRKNACHRKKRCLRVHVKQDFAFDSFLLLLLSFFFSRQYFFITRLQAWRVRAFLLWLVFVSSCKIENEGEGEKSARTKRKSTQFFHWHLYVHYLLSFFPFLLFYVDSQHKVFVSEFFWLQGEKKTNLSINFWLSKLVNKLDEEFF